MGMYLPGLVSTGQGEGEFDVSLFGVASVPQRVEAASPWGNPSFVGKANDSKGANETHANDGGIQERLKLLRRHMGPDKLSKCDDLKQTEYTCRYHISFWSVRCDVKHTKSSHMFARPDRLESHERYLHASKSSDGIPRRVRDIETAAETPHDHERQGMQRNHICNECVATWVNQN